MINNRFRTIVSTAVGSALLASGLGLAAVTVAGTANAIPVDPPQAVCYEMWSDGTYFSYYC